MCMYTYVYVSIGGTDNVTLLVIFNIECMQQLGNQLWIYGCHFGAAVQLVFIFLSSVLLQASKASEDCGIGLIRLGSRSVGLFMYASYGFLMALVLLLLYHMKPPSSHHSSASQLLFKAEIKQGLAWVVSCMVLASAKGGESITNIQTLILPAFSMVTDAAEDCGEAGFRPGVVVNHALSILYILWPAFSGLSSWASPEAKVSLLYYYTSRRH